MAKVTVYTTPICVWCGKVKELLKQNNIMYEEINIAADQKAAEYIIEKSGQLGVPITEIDGQIIIGFDKNALKKALNIA